MAVFNICKTWRAVGDWTPGLRRYVITYRADCSLKSDGPLNVLQSPLSPKLLTTTYSFGNEWDAFAICTKIGVPRRAAGDSSPTQWIFDAEFTFDRESRPEYQAKTIEPFFISGTKAIERAKFLGWYKPVGDGLIPVSIDGSKLLAGATVGPITSSALVPVLPTPEKPSAIPGFRVRWIRKTYPNSIGGFLNHTNIEPFTFTAVDDFNGSVVFTKTWTPRQLFLAGIQSTPIQIYAKTWYEMVLEFNEIDGSVYELDRGLSEYAESGDRDGRGGNYDSGDFVEGQPNQRRINDTEGQPITEPVMLDGKGKQNAIQKPDNAIYLRWEFAQPQDFSGIPFGVD